VSNALGLNNKGQVVGGSAPSGAAVLWENGAITDLNTVVCHQSSLYLDYAGDINDRGEITGQAIDTNTGAFVGFLAVPAAPQDGCETDPSAERRFVLPANGREQFRQRKGFGRFVAGPIRPQ
jgi:probable HAF family extracellular repeat protein